MPARARRLPVAGHWLELRGHAVLVDGELRGGAAGRDGVAAGARPAAGAGGVAGRAAAAALPGAGVDEHAVETAMTRLRAALGDAEVGPDRGQAAVPARARPGGRVRALPGRGAPVSAQLLLVAHGTRDPAGATVTEAVAEQVRGLLGVQVSACYVDVRHPTPAEALAELPGPVVAVPMFLAAGYHVRVDVPAQLAATGRADVRLAETFGPDPALVDAAASRLRAAGMRAGDAVVLAVVGSTDRGPRPTGPRRPTAGAGAARTRHAGHDRDGRAAGGGGGGPAASRRGAPGGRRVLALGAGVVPACARGAGADVVAEPLATHEAVASSWRRATAPDLGGEPSRSRLPARRHRRESPYRPRARPAVPFAGSGDGPGPGSRPRRAGEPAARWRCAARTCRPRAAPGARAGRGRPRRGSGRPAGRDRSPAAATSPYAHVSPAGIARTTARTPSSVASSIGPRNSRIAAAISTGCSR